MNEIFREHLHYEIIMLRETFRLLSLGVYSQAGNNALIESFCVHARALIEFFSGTSSITEDYVTARHFAVDGYEPLHVSELLSKYNGKLNGQIAHLTYNRTGNNDHKVTHADRTALLNRLNEEVDHFWKFVKDIYKPLWPKPPEASGGPKGPPSTSHLTITAGPTGPTQPASLVGASSDVTSTTGVVGGGVTITPNGLVVRY